MAAILEGAWQRDARKLRAAGWATQRIAKHLGKPYTTTYEAVRDVKPAKRSVQLVSISGQARGHLWDAAERWLAGLPVLLPDGTTDQRADASDYTELSADWQTTSEDAQARACSGDELHSTLAGLRPLA